MIEGEVSGPAGRTELDLGRRGRHQVGEARCVAGRDHVDLVPFVELEGLVGIRAQDGDLPDVARPLPDVARLASKYQPIVRPVALLERPAHDLPPRLGPRVALTLDRMPRLRPAVGPVPHA